jgi:hypothetical protein
MRASRSASQSVRLGQASVWGGTETAFYPSTRMRPQSLTRLLWLVALVVGCNYVFALIASR